MRRRESGVRKSGGETEEERMKKGLSEAIGNAPKSCTEVPNFQRKERSGVGGQTGGVVGAKSGRVGLSRGQVHEGWELQEYRGYEEQSRAKE